ncbi:LysM peptidoglycan-binding domain-containing protein [Nostoc spongiaeforme FACHB-130]|uniref:LysM peptidoglycan-binding domain-containing protein n=1 Tax=Nostoc spongiaeforme FACHB-130 TaxID=1357510 RepID=A0ABR8G2M7_9NOSO|nr:LysM peptidoglycan-binding domain-containing protein [Nostoc spongiaeforme FACHB-130]
MNYRVKKRETLYKLAPQYGYSDRRQFVNDFLKLNPHVTNPNLIYANQRYVMPIKPMIAGATYSDIFTRKTYQVNAYGRHIQTGIVPR